MILVALGGIGLASLAGCGLQKGVTVKVLKTEDFVGDPGTMPTQAQASVKTTDASPAPAAEQRAPVTIDQPPALPTPPKTISVAAASDGLFDVLAVPGAPESGVGMPGASGPPQLVDAKVGELNGRPVRATDILDELGPRLKAVATNRKMSADEWEFLTGERVPARMEEQPVTRETWLKFARRRIQERLESALRDELLTEEARFSLKKPEEKAGLKYFVQQISEQRRREVGGTNAELERQLRSQNKTIQQYTKEAEARELIKYQISQKIWKQTVVSWKDIRQYYEKHPEIYHPPAKVSFRLIQVPAQKAEDIAKVQAALDAGKPFAEVAAMPENTYNRAEGGLFPVQTLKGAYADAQFFTGELSAAAKKLEEGHFSKEPVDFGTDKTWVYLEKIERKDLPLSSREVQLSIEEKLNKIQFDLALKNYMQRLRSRASFSEMDAIAIKLTEIAAERYWPEGT